MTTISLKGVVVGSITDVAATALLTIPLSLYVIVTKDLRALSDDQITRAVTESLRHETLLYILQSLIGGGCSVLGGYLAARIAKRDALLNGALSSFLCVMSGLYSLATGTGGIPLWEHAVWFVIAPVLGTLGGYTWLRKARPTP